MSFNDLRWLAPAPQPEIEILEAHQTAREFYREVQHRQDFDSYCQWYYSTAERHRQELQKMRGDINIFGWFLRGRR
ncbi:MAG: hypothetical protein MUC60_11230 [Oscillatoria sp. Prado101]|jgi:gamma-glutamylcyclotransferase (GGCT)/AIG2-like uncharacterized protein YtfP|nr:hypothetical protein [Oscillatoria sp. Prado101]